MMRSLTRDETIALFVASVVALDYSVIAAATDGRMDMMCAALGQAALASFLSLRNSNWPPAIFLAACFGAAALFCHPLGLVSTVSLAALNALRWRQIRWKAMVAASVPYIFGAALCLRYILEAPQIFLAQSRAASAYRMTTWKDLAANFFNDLPFRYFGMYYASLAGINKLKAASLLFALFGTAGLALHPKLRRKEAGRTLLLLAFIGYAGVAVIDNQKFPVYFIFSMPTLTACAALWTYGCWPQAGVRRALSSALLAGGVLATIGGFTVKSYQDGYHRLYLPVISAIKANLPPGGLVMGGSELGFALGFGPPLIDDRYVGCSSGKRSDIFVENHYYGRVGQVGQAATTLLQTQYHLIFENSDYRVYLANATSLRGAPHVAVDGSGDQAGGRR